MGFHELGQGHSALSWAHPRVPSATQSALSQCVKIARVPLQGVSAANRQRLSVPMVRMPVLYVHAALGPGWS